jgi:hypothetical protein
MLLLIAAALAASSPAVPAPPPDLAPGSAASGVAGDGGWQASLDDARWTGSLLSTSGETLPRGHVYFEPYLYDVVSHGRHQLGSQSYIEYGVADTLTIGVIPLFALFSGPRNAPILGGDIKLMAQYRLTHFTPAHRIPSISLLIREKLPTGRFDGLARASQGQGGGVFATEVGINIQHYLRPANGRLLRLRLNLLRSFAGSTKVHDASVYGTVPGYRGRAYPGNSWSADLAGEYGLTREWVLALDILHEGTSRGRIAGQSGPAMPPSERILAPSSNYALAPAVEYNMSALAGMIFGVRIIPKGRNASGSITPAIAYSKAW